MKKRKRKRMDGGKSAPNRGGMELCKAMKMKGERTRRSAFLFLQLSSRSYLMAGCRFTQIITASSNMKSHLCVRGAKERKGTQGERQNNPFISLINHLYCHLNLFLHLQMTSRLLIWNNKQKCVDIQLIKMCAETGQAYSCSCSCAVSLRPALFFS